MTVSVGNLVAQLSANIAEFQKGMGQAVTIMNSSAAKMNTTLQAMSGGFRQFQTVATGVMAAVTTSMVAQGVKSAIDYAASLDDVARTASVTTTELQQYRQVLQQGGADAKAADAILIKFSDTIGEAAKGSAVAQENLARLGISARDLTTMNLGQLFEKATNSLSRFSTVGERNNVVNDIFGKQALKNADALSVSTAAMNAAKKEAIDLGLVLDEQTIAKAKKLRQELDDTSQKLLNTFAPALIAAGRAAATAGNFVTEFVQKISNSEASEKKLADLNRRLSETKERLRKLNEEPGWYEKLLPDFAKKNLASNLRGEIARYEQSIAAVKAKMAAEDLVAPGTGKPKSATSGAVTKVEVPKEHLALLQKIRQETEAVYIGITDDHARQAELRFQKSREEMQFRLKQEKLWADDVTKVTNPTVKKAMEEYVEWEKAKQLELDKARRTPLQTLADDWLRVTHHMQEATARWTDRAADELTDFVMTGKASFKDFADAVVRDFVRIQIQKNMALGMSQLGGQSSGGSWLSALSSFFGGGSSEATAFSSGTQPMAEGGPVMAGRSYVVGDGGEPEFFTPGASGYITPFSKAGGSGGEPVIVMNISTGVAQTVQAELRAMMPQIAEKTKAAVAEGRMRGGKYASAFGG